MSQFTKTHTPIVAVKNIGKRYGSHHRAARA